MAVFFVQCLLHELKKINAFYHILPAFRLGGSGFRGVIFLGDLHWRFMRTMISCPGPGNRWLVIFFARAGYSKHRCSMWKMDMDIFSIHIIHIQELMSILAGEIWWNHLWNPNFKIIPSLCIQTDIMIPSVFFHWNPKIWLLKKWWWNPLKYGIPIGSPRSSWKN